MSLLTKTSTRYLLRHPWQLALAILGIALGVAVVVAIDLANDSARRAFALSTETIAGRATHQITGGPSGLPEDVYRQLRVVQGVRPAAPLVDGYVSAPDHPALTLHVLGIDPFAEGPFRPWLAGGQGNSGAATTLLTEPGAALLSAATAQANGLKAGDLLRIQVGPDVRSARLVGLLEPENDQSRRALDGLLITDIATAQEWLGMVGKLSQIDLILPDDAAAQRVAAALPAGAQLGTPAGRTQTLQQMTAAFELNLSALSLLALVVGMFLIYNTMTFSVVQRRSLLGTIRCLGVTRREIFALIAAEAMLVGVVGALLGVLLGVLLGRGLVSLVTRTINDLYFAVTVREVAIAPWPLLKGFTLGMLATLAAAAGPAWEATTTPARSVLRRSSYEEQARRVVPLVAGAGAALLALGGVLLVVPSRDLVLAFTGLFLLTIGAAAVTPLVTLLLMRLVGRPLGWGFGLLGKMAARDVTAALSRTSVAIAALMIAVSVTVGVGLMVGSFRTTVVRWLEATLVADIYISPPSRAANQIETSIAPEVVARLEQTPGVTGMRRYRSVNVNSPGGLTLLIATDVVPERDGRAFTFVGGDRTAIFQQFAQGAALISEPLAYRRNLAPGDTITLDSDRGPVTYPIAGVFYDYGSDRGVVMLKTETYRQSWNDITVSSLSFYAAPGQDVDQLVERLREVASTGSATGGGALAASPLGGRGAGGVANPSPERAQRAQPPSERSPRANAVSAAPERAPASAAPERAPASGAPVAQASAPLLFIRSNAALRSASLEIFDRTFAITGVLQLLATIVAFVGILAALMALQLERARELGVLRANGLTPAQLWGVVVSQTGLMGLTAGLLALPVGVMLAAVLVFVINKRSFGWTLLFELDARLFAQAVFVAVLAAVLAGLYPAWRMARTSPALALREE